jgi:hypothetical protein
MEMVEQLFGRFQRSDRRCRLFAQLREYVAELCKTDWEFKLIIDGSFVMSCVDEPEDIDLLLVMPEDWDFATQVPPFEYNLRSRRQVRKRTGLELKVVPGRTAAELEWTDFFMQVNPKWQQQLNLPKGLKKGIVRIVT